MSGDLEDFLRRAAERRKQKAGGQGGAQGQPRQNQPAQPPPRQAPQYTDHKSERHVRSHDDDVVMAEVVGDRRADNEADMRRKVTEAKRQAHQAQVVAANNLQREADARAAQEKIAKATAKKQAKDARAKANSAAALAAGGTPSEELIKLLTTPGGIQQAILLREILDRPEHRW